MPFLAEAREFIPAPLDACLAMLRDFDSWTRWMPDSFRPVAGPSHALVEGDRIAVRIRGVPGVAKMAIARYVPGRTLAWSGGVPGVLSAVHAFHFEARDGGTMVHSEEIWRGALSHVAPVAQRVRVQAEQVGRDQLAGLARALREAR